MKHASQLALALLQTMTVDMQKYILPDSAISDREFASMMIGHLDGPQQREVQAAIEAEAVQVESVAWMYQMPGNFMPGASCQRLDKIALMQGTVETPLYTTPQPAPEWTEVADVLPEIDVPVLAMINDQPCIYPFCRVDVGDDGWLWAPHNCGPLNDKTSYEADDDYDVVRWMPLPAAPRIES